MPAAAYEQLPGARKLDLLLRRRLRHAGQHRQERRLHDQPIGLVAAGLAHDDAARWSLGRRGIAELLQRQRIQDGAVHRHMPDHHRIVRKRLVQVVAVQQPPAGHYGVVVAVGEDQLALRDFPVIAKLDQRGHQARHIRGGPGRRRVHVGLVGDGEGLNVVAVRIDESRQQRMALQIDQFRRSALVGRLDAGARADREDLAVLHRECLGVGLPVIDGDDVAAEVDNVRDVGARRTVGGWAAACGNGQGGQRYKAGSAEQPGIGHVSAPGSRDAEVGLVPEIGIEPTTYALRMRRSTN